MLISIDTWNELEPWMRWALLALGARPVAPVRARRGRR